MKPIIILCMFVAGSLAHPSGYGYSAPAPAPAAPPVLSYSAPAPAPAAPPKLSYSAPAPAAPVLSYGSPAAPAYGASGELLKSVPTSPPIPIIRHTNEIQHEVGGKVSFETGNGINHEYNLAIKRNPNAVGTPEDSLAGSAEITRSGTVSYTAPTGERINLQYHAGENGFTASGDHIPQMVTETPEVAQARREHEVLFKAAEKAAAEAPEFPVHEQKAQSYGYGYAAPAPAAPVVSAPAAPLPLPIRSSPY